MIIFRLTTLTAALFLATTTARAQDTSPELLQAALQAAVTQRNDALNEGVQASAQLTLAQREIARLRKELDEAKKPAPSPAPSPAPTESEK